MYVITSYRCSESESEPYSVRLQLFTSVVRASLWHLIENKSKSHSPGQRRVFPRCPTAAVATTRSDALGWWSPVNTGTSWTETPVPVPEDPYINALNTVELVIDVLTHTPSLLHQSSEENMNSGNGRPTLSAPWWNAVRVVWKQQGKEGIKTFRCSPKSQRSVQKRERTLTRF